MANPFRLDFKNKYHNLKLQPNQIKYADLSKSVEMRQLPQKIIQKQSNSNNCTPRASKQIQLKPQINSFKLVEFPDINLMRTRPNKFKLKFSSMRHINVENNWDVIEAGRALAKLEKKSPPKKYSMNQLFSRPSKTFSPNPCTRETNSDLNIIQRKKETLKSLEYEKFRLDKIISEIAYRKKMMQELKNRPGGNRQSFDINSMFDQETPQFENYLKEREKHQKAITIQKQIRTFLFKRSLHKLIDKRNQKKQVCLVIKNQWFKSNEIIQKNYLKDVAAVKIQKYMRAYVVNTKYAKQKFNIKQKLNCMHFKKVQVKLQTESKQMIVNNIRRFIRHKKIQERKLAEINVDEGKLFGSKVNQFIVETFNTYDDLKTTYDEVKNDSEYFGFPKINQEKVQEKSTFTQNCSEISQKLPNLTTSKSQKQKTIQKTIQNKQKIIFNKHKEELQEFNKKIKNKLSYLRLDKEIQIKEKIRQEIVQRMRSKQKRHDDSKSSYDMVEIIGEISEELSGSFSD